jgi:hypothetical protein
LRPDAEYVCDKRDIQTIRIKRFAVFETFNEKKCNGGDEMGIIELEQDIQVSSNFIQSYRILLV